MKKSEHIKKMQYAHSRYKKEVLPIVEEYLKQYMERKQISPSSIVSDAPLL